MTSFTKLAIWGGIAVVVFDAAASLASLSFGFPYGSAGLGSYLVYGGIGFVGGRLLGWTKGAMAAIVAGAVDATLGWGVSWLLGPGKPPTDEPFSPFIWFVVAVVVTSTAAVCGAIGGAIGQGTRGG